MGRRAGLLGRQDQWESLLGLVNIHFQAGMRRWLDTGSLTCVHVHQLWGRTPRRQALTQEEQVWCEKQVKEVLLPVGAMEEVDLERLLAKRKCAMWL